MIECGSEPNDCMKYGIKIELLDVTLILHLIHINFGYFSYLPNIITVRSNSVSML